MKTSPGTSVVDPDPHGSILKLPPGSGSVVEMRIRIQGIIFYKKVEIVAVKVDIRQDWQSSKTGRTGRKDRTVRKETTGRTAWHTGQAGLTYRTSWTSRKCTEWQSRQEMSVLSVCLACIAGSAYAACPACNSCPIFFVITVCSGNLPVLYFKTVLHVMPVYLSRLCACPACLVCPACPLFPASSACLAWPACPALCKVFEDWVIHYSTER